MQYQLPIKHEPTREAALRVLSTIDPVQYSRSRNFLDGAVTGLSPWITHGYIHIKEATRLVMKKHSLSFEDKLVFEFAWREFFKHVHGELGHKILSDVRRPVWSGRYNQQMPVDVIEARTGVQAIDDGIALLYETGYLHNHVRMWIASYLVHMRKIHWKVGADWMYSHLLDGDLASNHLSWQWVAGTFSHKPYLFNADNVRKYAAKWNCSGTCIDTDYETLELIARNKRDVGREKNAPSLGLAEPVTQGFNVALLNEAMKNKTIDLRSKDESMPLLNPDKNLSRVHLVHPWDLSACFEPAAEGELKIGVIDTAFHAAHPWSEKRWNFVLSALESGCGQIWVLNTNDHAGNSALLQHLRQADLQFNMRDTLNPGYSAIEKCIPVHWLKAESLLPNPSRFQQSFSRFYKEATLMAGSLDEAVHGGSLVD